MRFVGKEPYQKNADVVLRNQIRPWGMLVEFNLSRRLAKSVGIAPNKNRGAVNRLGKKFTFVEEARS